MLYKEFPLEKFLLLWVCLRRGYEMVEAANQVQKKVEQFKNRPYQPFLALSMFADLGKIVIK